MDGFNSSDSVVVIAATNSPKTLDKALTRPGRLDRTVSVDPPDLKGRTQIINHYMGKVAIDESVDAAVCHLCMQTRKRKTELQMRNSTVPLYFDNLLVQSSLSIKHSRAGL